MASVSDIHNIEDQFTYQLEKLDEADIDEHVSQAIRGFIRYQNTQRGLAASTNVNNCSDLRLSAERADTPLMEMERSEVDALLFDYKHDYEMADGTLRNYRKTRRKFFRYHDREWAEDIEIGAIPDREVDADKTLTEDEIGRLIQDGSLPPMRCFARARRYCHYRPARSVGGTICPTCFCVDFRLPTSYIRDPPAGDPHRLAI